MFPYRSPDITDEKRRELAENVTRTARRAAFEYRMALLGKPVAQPHIGDKAHARRRAANRVARATRRAQRKVGR